jgi:hypothetical protein
MPDGVDYVSDNETAALCRLAGIHVAPALVAIEPMGRNFLTWSKSVLSSRLVSIVGWQQLLKDWKESEAGQKKLRALEDAAIEKRKAIGRRGADTRARNRLLKKTPYGRLLQALELAQIASNRAKRRAANCQSFLDYSWLDDNPYAGVNYRRSRKALENDRLEKECHIKEALHEAPKAGVNGGWAEAPGEHVGYVVYFDLPTGQVSILCSSFPGGLAYPGKWDGQMDQGMPRIAEAIAALLTRAHKASEGTDNGPTVGPIPVVSPTPTVKHLASSNDRWGIL